REVQPGEIGELLFSGPAVVPGYEHHALPDHDGWYCSGDLARQDEDGFYHFIERKSGMIKVAGLKVYPLQVEQVLQQHPSIQEAAIIGIKEKRRGCVPLAFVVLEEGYPFTQDDLTQFCTQRLAPYMIPKQFCQLDSLPKIGSGKTNKKALSSLNNDEKTSNYNVII
ncbi:MAG: hypothetical protein D3923_18175, partial [Candidatus Electrothrix sp. AR3]|nr:hypothetical protein [Candidatus Electrothrix sp. AR3]